MAITNQNFSIFQRSDYDVECTISDEDGNPQDCTGASFEFVFTNARTGVNSLQISDDERFSISGVDNNIVTISIQEEELDIAPGVYRHELRLRDVFGNTAPVATGTVSLILSKTNVF